MELLMGGGPIAVVYGVSVLAQAPTDQPISVTKLFLGVAQGIVGRWGVQVLAVVFSTSTVGGRWAVAGGSTRDSLHLWWGEHMNPLLLHVPPLLTLFTLLTTATGEFIREPA